MVRRQRRSPEGKGTQAIRRAAASRLAGAAPPVALGPRASRAAALHELAVHQAELELQNEELRRAQQALEAERDRYLALYDFAPVGYLTLDPAGRVQELNLAAAAMLGEDRAALRGRAFLPFVAAAERGRWTAFLDAVAAGGGPPACELALHPVRGGPVPLEVTAGRAGARGADPGAIRCALVDVSERRRAAAERERRIAELQDLNARLEEARLQVLQADKLAAIGLLAAGVAHELNNPLAYVKSNLFVVSECVEALLASPGPAAAPEDLRQALADAREGVERVARVVADLRAFAHADTGHWERADLHEVLQRALRIVTGAAGGALRVALEAAPVAPRVHCRPSQLEQVFMNLLVNAAQAVQGGGAITVRTGVGGAAAWVEVEDTGPGIPQANLGRIFEPFYTTKPVGEGTGLGLSLAHGIVKAHGGHIEVRSVVGQGSTFRVTLPLDGPGPAAAGEGRYLG